MVAKFSARYPMLSVLCNNRLIRPLAGTDGTPMKNLLTTVAVIGTLLTGCNGSPGPLEGTWTTSKPLPMTIAFRPGETEAMGVIEHVDYKTAGNTVEITYKDGLMKGSSMKFFLLDSNTATNAMYTLRRVR